jgi:hypothetical protein
MLIRLFKWLSGDRSQTSASQASAIEVVAYVPTGQKPDTPPSNEAPKASQPPTQPRLVENLKENALCRWPAEKLLFHGCTDKSRHTDVTDKTLAGDFKWMSEDAEYAAEYGLYQGADGGSPYLFVCKLKREAVAIKASQKTLHGFTDWKNAAPWRFPVEFGPIAREAFGTEEPIIFLDHRRESGEWGEILVPDPAKNLVVIDVIALPAEKEKAREFAKQYAIGANS